MCVCVCVCVCFFLNPAPYSAPGARAPHYKLQVGVSTHCSVCGTASPGTRAVTRALVDAPLAGGELEAGRVGGARRVCRGGGVAAAAGTRAPPHASVSAPLAGGELEAAQWGGAAAVAAVAAAGGEATAAVVRRLAEGKEGWSWAAAAAARDGRVGRGAGV